jgi:hypothetical protein
LHRGRNLPWSLCLLVSVVVTACGLDPISPFADVDGNSVGGGGGADVGFDLDPISDASELGGSDTGSGDVGDDTAPDAGGDDAGTDDAGGGDGGGSDAGGGTGDVGADTDVFDPGEALLDSDHDGIADVHEGNCAVDTDFDGTPDCYDLDSDNDRIPDSVEAGDRLVSTRPADSDGDGRPDFIDYDSDGDGIEDVVEGPLDFDEDGRGNWRDDDSDGDGIPDAVEGVGDPDGDTWPNFADIDSDGDTIHDRDETAGDEDEDGVPNYLDLDSDDDGLSDAFEAGDADVATPPWDTDRDFLSDARDLESDGDGILDSVEGAGDPDGDGVPNFRDRDSDGDTIDDIHEGDVDTDTDGTLDRFDADSDGDGIPDRTEAGDGVLTTAPIDTDRDGTPDFRDLDADGDTLSDAFEGLTDFDADGLGNWLDFDSDGDTVSDEVEGTADPDGDGAPNFLDLDSDGDTIADSSESLNDNDEDGTPDRLDLDSDNDTVPDAVEAGDASLATLPVDTDGDGRRDYVDIDSDGDGLSDRDERGCPASSNRLAEDSDADSFSDMAEVAVGSNPCSAGSDVYDFTDFFFVLPRDVEEDAPLEFATDVTQADVVFNMDTTGSMSEEIGALQSSLTGTIIPQVAGVISNVAFGVTSFRDFPVSNFGSGGDYPYRIDQSITTSTSAAQGGVNRLGAGGGADGPESGWESLYQIATGSGGVSWPGGSIGATSLGWRSGSLPLVVHITDAVSHASTDYSGWVTGAHSYAQASSSLRARSMRVIGVASGTEVRNELRTLATETGAVVPACAFNNACGAGMCCTGLGGTAESPVGGSCPLVFNISSNGTGLSTRVVDAIEFLVTAGSVWITTRVQPDPAALGRGIDTSCFIEAVIPERAVAADSCAGTPTRTDRFPPAGELDSFDGVTPGTRVFFQVYAANRGCVEPTLLPQAFSATIEVVADGVTVVDRRDVTVIIPGELPDQF